MATTSRQTSIFGIEDWKKFYQTYNEADLQSYDFETLRKTFVDYLRVYYPETFNDFIESSEFVALLDVMAFMGQALSFRNDLNTREAFLSTAERRDSVNNLASLVGYTPKRNEAGQGYLKVLSVSTTEDVQDYNGNILSNVTINWNDTTNPDWQEQFNAIINAMLVDSQRVGRPGSNANILDVKTDVYSINQVPGYLAAVPFNATVDGVNMSFEAVSSVISNGTIIEPAPNPNGVFNILYRTDNLGYASSKTGFFFKFKQGSLTNQDFNLSDRISNRTVSIGIEGVNENDVWLYSLDEFGNTDTEWNRVANIFTVSADNQTNGVDKNYFSINSKTNDKIDLVFGDGVFSTIPTGLFRCYVRASNGLEYIINEEEMQTVQLSLSYVSRIGRLETVTFTVGLTEPVSNSRARETIADIKTRAPARYYTQNRMVNGEDYTNFPYTEYNSIIKSSAVNRSSIGSSRYLDLVDITGKYSSTNVFGSDGMIYRQTVTPTSTFTWLDNNDIADAIFNKIIPAISARGSLHFYHSQFARPSVSALDVTWNQTTALTNETTGYFKNSIGAPRPIGGYASDNLKYVVPNALIKFVPPAGYFFDRYNRLKAGTPVAADEKTVIWATVTGVTLDGTNFGLGNLDTGEGPVSINNFVPTGAIITEVIPKFVTLLSTALQQSITTQVQLYRNFGLGYDITTQDWYLINSSNLARDAEFATTNAQSTAGLNNDASWLIQVTTDGEIFTVKSRNLNYYFASVLETRFFFDNTQQIYDSKTGSIVNDFIKVLKTNSKPDVNSPLESAVSIDIVDQPIQSDGFVDDFQVLISYTDSDNDGIADNPDFFTDLVNPTVTPSSKLVFLQRTVDFDNLERYLPIASRTINSQYATQAAIEAVKTEYSNGAVFYATTDEKFYELSVSALGVRTLSERTDYIARVGRQDLNFQYRHNSPLSRRIDPGTTNIIDLFVVTSNYYNNYANWIRDITGTVTEPPKPTIEELTLSYGGLQKYKMLSDSVILNSVKFKPLFGDKAELGLQATIKVVRYNNSTVSVSEVKSRLINVINSYFTIDKWDFGSTFYFSELASYIHEQIGDIISSVVLVPRDPIKAFGDLYEIRSAPYEILISAATVNDIEVIDALTSSALRTATNSGIQ